MDGWMQAAAFAGAAPHRAWVFPFGIEALRHPRARVPGLVPFVLALCSYTAPRPDLALVPGGVHSALQTLPGIELPVMPQEAVIHPSFKCLVDAPASVLLNCLQASPYPGG